MCIAVSLFGCLDGFAKYLVNVGELPVVQVAGMRMGINMLLLIAVFAVLFGPTRLPRVMRTVKPLQQFLRSLCMAGATLFNFLAVKYLQLDQTITLFYTTPLLVALFAGPILGEWVGCRRMLAIIVGFLGVLLVTRPGLGGIHWAFVFSLAAALCYAFYNIATRYLSYYDSTETTLFYTPLLGALITLPFVISDWHWPQTSLHWFLLFLIGALGAAGHFLLIVAFRSGPAPILAPFMYSNLLAVIALGYLLFGDVPSLWTLAGGVVLIASGLYIFYREKNAGPAETMPPPN